MTKIKYLILLMCAVVFSVNAQETDAGIDVEEVVVTGTQIKGARINEALPVTVITKDDNRLRLLLRMISMIEVSTLVMSF